MKAIEITAKTSEEAIEIALKELDAEREEVEIDVVTNGKAGILGIGSEPARVKVTLLEDASDVVKIVTEILHNLLKNLGVSARSTLRFADREDQGGPVFEIEGEDSGLLIGRRGETLRALEFLVKFMAGKRLGYRVNLMVDVEGYQERRIQSLTNLAHRVGQRVTTSGRPITLEPMPPNERRVVHMALSDHSKVMTESIGVADGRQVVVSLR